MHLTAGQHHLTGGPAHTPTHTQPLGRGRHPAHRHPCNRDTGHTPSEGLGQAPMSYPMHHGPALAIPALYPRAPYTHTARDRHTITERQRHPHTHSQAPPAHMATHTLTLPSHGPQTATSLPSRGVEVMSPSIGPHPDPLMQCNHAAMQPPAHVRPAPASRPRSPPPPYTHAPMLLSRRHPATPHPCTMHHVDPVALQPCNLAALLLCYHAAPPAPPHPRFGAPSREVSP